MKSRLPFSALALFLAFATVAAASDALVLNGSGLRTKPLLGAMYELSLFVPQEMKGAHPKALVEYAQPMELSLLIKSSLINRSRFVEATSEGFEKAAQSGHASGQTQQFLKQFDAIEFRKGDTVVMRYENGGLVTLYRKAATPEAGATETKLGRIPGIELKQALFAIWLGDSPVQESLKKSLLGGQ